MVTTLDRLMDAWDRKRAQESQRSKLTMASRSLPRLISQPCKLSAWRKIKDIRFSQSRTASLLCGLRHFHKPRPNLRSFARTRHPKNEAVTLNKCKTSKV